MSEQAADLKSTSSSFSRGMQSINKNTVGAKRPQSAYNVTLGSAGLQKVQLKSEVVQEESMSKDD